MELGEMNLGVLIIITIIIFSLYCYNSCDKEFFTQLKETFISI